MANQRMRFYNCAIKKCTVRLSQLRSIRFGVKLPRDRMVASDTFAEFLQEQLAPLGRVTVRRMFGKSGVFCDGVMLGMVTENTLYFRVDD